MKIKRKKNLNNPTSSLKKTILNDISCKKERTAEHAVAERLN